MIWSRRIESMRLQLTETSSSGPSASAVQDQRRTETRARMPANDEYLKTFDVLKRTTRDYLLPNWKLVLVSLVASTVVAASTGVLPLLIKFVFDEVLTDKNDTMLVLVACGAAAASAFKGIATYGTNITKNLIGQKIISEPAHRCGTDGVGLLSQLETRAAGHFCHSHRHSLYAQAGQEDAQGWPQKS